MKISIDLTLNIKGGITELFRPGFSKSESWYKARF